MTKFLGKIKIQDRKATVDRKKKTYQEPNSRRKKRRIYTKVQRTWLP
jgi:hypothetical protein